MARSRLPELAELAESSDGFITSKMASEIGIAPAVLVKMGDRGVLERSVRGLYRIASFPVTDLTQYWEAVLAVAEDAVISHQSSLTLRRLTDANPAKIHVTVPMSRRLRRNLPPFIAVHRTNLDPVDVTTFETVPVTTIVCSIIQCIESSVEPSIIRQAIIQANAERLITDREARALETKLP